VRIGLAGAVWHFRPSLIRRKTIVDFASLSQNFNPDRGVEGQSTAMGSSRRTRRMDRTP
jgi:hypothetical protein